MSSDSHGGTVAAWTAVAIIIGGTIISSVALPLRSPLLFFVGVGVIVLGAIVGKVMSMMGLGHTVAYKDERDPDYEGEGEAAAGPAAGTTEIARDQEADQPTKESAS